MFWRACVRTYTSISSDSVTVSTYLGCVSQGEGCHADATIRTVVKRTLPPQATLVSLSLSVEKDETRNEGAGKSTYTVHWRVHCTPVAACSLPSYHFTV